MKQFIALIVSITIIGLAQPSGAKELKVATWNIEHLAEKNNTGCKPRSDADYKNLKQFAETLKLDIVAVQEVENMAALRRVFPENIWQIEMAKQTMQLGTKCNDKPGYFLNPQLTGFAIRKGISYKRLADVRLSDNKNQRVGTQIRLNIASNPIDVLSVHLKSGCFHDGHRNKEACDILYQQIPKLESWIDDKANNKINVIILGDFNRRLNEKKKSGNGSSLKEDSVWTEIDDGQPNEYANLERITYNVKPCQGYKGLIDHIIASNELGTKFSNTTLIEYEQKPLSDHCPLVTTLSLSTTDSAPHPLSTTQALPTTKILPGLSGEELRTQLKQTYYKNKHKKLGYDSARKHMFGEIDVINGEIRDVYAGLVKKSAVTTFLDPINTEHTVPQSWFAKKEPMKSDLHHLFPTHKDVNNIRGSYPFNDIKDYETTAWYIYETNKLIQTSRVPQDKIDQYSEYKDGSFEPPEAHKGNLARAVAYFYTMYKMDSSHSILKLVGGDIALLKKWHEQDPVDAQELRRNRLIEKHQGNINPYIEDSTLLCRAWGC